MPRKRKGARVQWRQRQGFVAIIPAEGRGRPREVVLDTRSEAEAEKRLAAIIREGLADPAPMTVAEALDFYMTQHLRMEKETRTIARFETHQDKLVRHFGELPATGVTIEARNSYVTARREGQYGKKPAADGTINSELTMLRAALRYAYGNQRIDKAPAIKMLPRSVKTKKTLITKPMLAAMFAHARRARDNNRNNNGSMGLNADGQPRMTRLERFLHIISNTGARLRAVTGLKWDQVDFGQGLVFLEATDRFAPPTKRRATAPMTQRLREALEQAHAERTTEWVLDHPGEIRTAWRLCCEKTGFRALAGRCESHAFRRTAASQMADDPNIPDIAAAAFLGMTLETFINHYAKPQLDSVRAAANVMENFGVDSAT